MFPMKLTFKVSSSCTFTWEMYYFTTRTVGNENIVGPKCRVVSLKRKRTTNCLRYAIQFEKYVEMTIGCQLQK